jgi:catechol 2,3-dioxygenase-like lactoylglutathione lyase family enzyme
MEVSMTTLKLKHPIVDIAITCSNFEESLRFYHELLGLEIVMELDISAPLAKTVGLAPRGFHQVRLQAGNTLIKLMDIEMPPPPPDHSFGAGLGWLTILVEDIAETVKNLKREGVEFVADPVDGPDAVGVACAKAPDGIIIEFVQP